MLDSESLWVAFIQSASSSLSSAAAAEVNVR